MKKLLSSITLFIVLPFCAHAQRNEFDASINIGNATIVSQGGFEDFFTGNEFTPKSFSPSFFLTLKHYFPNHLGLGITGGIFFDKGDYAYRERSDSYNVGPYSRTSFILSPELEVPYYIQHGLKLYMVVGLGARFSAATIDGNSTSSYARPEPNVIIPALQYTPIGVRFGTGIGGFAELGWGYKGIINAGFFMKF
ncbi:MAG: hypothetical protein JSS96_05870 [Bacteroidetes bacterium]|nr:hypothetical protein [Bacteroidota bacterium]